jgi:hypothetical protein
MQLEVDGHVVDLSKTVSYKGMMLSGAPNFVWTIGYTNASWTLKADLVAEYVCRLLKHMDENDYAAVTPDAAGATAANPFLDLASGYVKRSLAELPKQGDPPCGIRTTSKTCACCDKGRSMTPSCSPQLSPSRTSGHGTSPDVGRLGRKPLCAIGFGHGVGARCFPRRSASRISREPAEPVGQSTRQPLPRRCPSSGRPPRP